MQFSRVITPVENIQVWNTTSDGFSFVISFASRSGPGFRGNTGFIASWRPIHQNRSAVKVIGSPFKTFPEAEKACEAVLGHLKERARGYSHASPLRAGWLARAKQLRAEAISYWASEGSTMSCRINRAATLRANGLAWRDRVIADAESVEGRVVARNHRVSLDLIDEVAARIASYLARGEVLVDWRDTIGALCGPGQTRRVVSYLKARGHVERTEDRDLIRPVG